ncbi:hypothetical protein KC326_g168 [Hortaea werneckii]|nr:hypothetical protein KC326_g168 [Hortaea werneckii]
MPHLGPRIWGCHWLLMIAKADHGCYICGKSPDPGKLNSGVKMMACRSVLATSTPMALPCRLRASPAEVLDSLIRVPGMDRLGRGSQLSHWP